MIEHDFEIQDRQKADLPDFLKERQIEEEREITGPVAPDVMVVFGRPKGRRGSYKQWQEDNIAPQVVFAILSPSNSLE